MNSGGFSGCQGCRGQADGAHTMFVPVIYTSFECDVCTLACSSPSNRSDPVDYLLCSVWLHCRDETCFGRRADGAGSHLGPPLLPSPLHMFFFTFLQLWGPDRSGSPPGVADVLASSTVSHPLSS